MAESNSELKTAFATIDERWDPQRTERTLRALQRKRQQTRRRQRALAAVGVACACGALAIALARKPANPTTPTSHPSLQPMAAAPAQLPLHMQLADGSDVSLHDAAAQVIVDEVSPSRVALALMIGQARFDVLHREERVFRVRSGDVTVEVLGTSFELEREASRTRVSVLRGRVAVFWPKGRAELAAGEAGWFPRADPASPAPLDVTSHNPKRTARKARAGAALGSTSAWREPAEQGDFEHAYELLAHAPEPVADNVEELLLAADTARLSGHAAAALPFLKRVVAEHAADSRAPLAAFTLGGVLMQQLGQPREAESAYARARELSLNSSLAEDALARQVEAAQRAGDSSRARALASEYVARYPNGRRIHAVQRFGGLVP
jgi:transmembrane sensor